MPDWLHGFTANALRLRGMKPSPSLAAQFRHFATHECPHDPLYQAICSSVAESPALLALMEHAPPTQQKPVLLLASLHERILSGADHALAAYYPSVGGTRAPDPDLLPALLDFVDQERAGLLESLRRRSTQTNEIGRCAALWPALQAIAAQSGRQDLALFDFGCSAGLNLGVDQYRYDYGSCQRGAAAEPGRPLIHCEWRGDAPLPREAAGFRLVERMGMDPSAIALGDEDAVRWLRACVWPSERERALRVDQAIELARVAAHRVQQAASGLDLLREWLDQLPPGVQPVLFNSWVLFYFSAEDLQRHVEAVAALVRGRGLIWLNAELPGSHAPGLARPAPLADEASATLWSLQWAEAGELQHRALAWSHPHGRWLQWLAP